MFYPSPTPQKWCHVTSLPPHNGRLFTTAAHLCLQGGRCREVELYLCCVESAPIWPASPSASDNQVQLLARSCGLAS